MAANTSAQFADQKRRFVFTRDFDAPRALVFELWTTERHLTRWFCPQGFVITDCEVAFRTGGGFHVGMRSPDGEDFRWQARYRDIAAPERIVFSHGLVDENDAPCFDVLTTVQFDEREGGTRITVEAAVQAIYDPASMMNLDCMEQGWTEALDKLAAYAAEA